MVRRSHDSSRPQTALDGARFRDQNCSAETASGRKSAAAGVRPRVDFHSADCVALRVAEGGRQAGLRGAVAEVLEAVITLLPREWSRIRDNRIRLQQLVNLCPSRPHQRTVGRSLRRLENLDLIRYEPACGRGNTALVVIAERFLHGIEELERDESGAVVVPFSRPYTTLFPRGKVPQPAEQEPAADAVAESRPVEVRVDQRELRAVLDQLPPLLADLPRNLRWLLGKEVRNKLARGHRPEEILRILEAPAPAGVERPYKLAIWRLAQNMVGAGPRLRPLQRSWDAAESDRQRREHQVAAAGDFERVAAVTTSEQRDRMLTWSTEMFGATSDARAAILTAARRARLQYPSLGVARAVAAWLENGDQHLQPPAPASRPSAVWATAGSACVSCGNPGSVRPELPLPTPVCDPCLDAASSCADDAWDVAS